MRIDWSQYAYQTDEDRQFIRLMRVARAWAAVVIIGGIAVVGVTGGPYEAETEVARANAAAPATAEGGLMALETGVPG